MRWPARLGSVAGATCRKLAATMVAVPSLGGSVGGSWGLWGVLGDFLAILKGFWGRLGGHLGVLREAFGRFLRALARV